MVGFQAAVGAVNDIVDADADRLVKPQKPLPAGVIAPPAASAIAFTGALLGLAISFALGPAVGLLGAAGLATGLLYDVVPRRWGLAWLCFVPAFPLLIAWTWVAATGDLPMAWPLLFAVAALAGPMISLANGLVDREADERTGRSGLAVVLGELRGRWLLAALTTTVHGLAWIALIVLAPRPVASLPIVVGAVGTALAFLGLAGSASADIRHREAGWLASAAGLGALGVAWVAAVETAS